MKKKEKSTEEIKKELLHKTVLSKPAAEDYVSTGSTLLNLAITGNPYWGFAKGRYYRLVGDSTSGKTFLSLTCFAEASINKNFSNYRLIYDDCEGGAMMNISKFFGPKVAERLEPPTKDEVGPIFSSTIEEFYYNVDDAFKQKDPFIYVLDSMDSISSKDEINKFDEQKKAYRKNREAAGSYGDGKAKKNSSNLRRLLGPLRRSGSILIIISQTRDLIPTGFMQRYIGDKRTESGGRALKFYAAAELWSSVKKAITKDVKGKKRELGKLITIRVKKNRITGKDRSVTIPIYHSMGIDDLGSCVDYLVEEFHWLKKKGAGIYAKEFKFQGTKDEIVKYVEGRGMERDLREIVAEVWHRVEKECEVIRKFRYG